MAKDNTLWVGTRGGGISAFKNGKFTTYTTNNGLTNNEIRNILEASDGSIWICTSDGLNRFKDGKFTNYTTENGLSYNIVYTIFEDENKVLWIGTYGGGLNRFKDGHFTVFTTKQGMYDNTIFQILEDNQKYFWLTCNRGIYRVSKKELNDYADGKIQTIHCTVFGTADGLRNAKCNGSCQPAGIRTRDGKLWIPTMKGVAIVDPAKLKQREIPPPVFIEHVLFDKQAIQIDSLIQAGPGQGELEICYTALNYIAPKIVNFKYMLVGFDKDWIDAGTRRVAYYTNIPPQSYTFKVIACNNDGVWNLNGATIKITISKYFYQTIWFRGLMVIVVLFIGFGAYRLRITNLRRHEQELVQIVDDRTKNLQREINERKRTEEELLIYSSRFEAMLASIPDIIMEVDNNKVYQWANHAGKEFFGEDVIGKEAGFYFEGEQKTYDIIQPLFLGNENIVYVESLQRRKDGKKRLLAWWSHVLKDENGNVTGALSTARDITEQKNAEKALRESEIKYREMVEQINDVIFATDIQGNFTYISPTAEILSGYKPEEMIGRSLAEFLDPDYVPKMKEQFQKILSGKLEPFEYRIKVKSGEFRWMRSSSKPILEGKEPVGLRGVLTDITARKQAEEALNLFSHSIKGISECISITDLNNTILFVNQAFLKTYGYSEEEVIGKPIYLVRSDTTTSDDIVLKKTLHGGWQGEILNRKKDGTVFPVSLSTSVVYNEKKQPIALVGVAIDISERKKSEEALGQERNLLRTMIDNMPDRIYAKDTESRFIVCNKALGTRMGMSNPDEIVGKSDFDFVTHELAARFRADELAIMQSGQPLINREEPMDSVTGITRWNLATKVPLRDNTGNIIGIVGMGRDITERKQAEQALKESEERYRRLVEFSPYAIAVHSEDKFVFVNPAAVKLLGAHDASELIGRLFLDIVHPDYKEIIGQRIITGIKDGTALPLIEEKFIRLDGEIVDVAVTSLPITLEGKPAMQIVASDITEQKKLRQELGQSQKMQSIGTLAGGIAHDFNNILGIILGYTSLLEKRKIDDPKLSEGMAVIHQTAQRGAALVRQILTFARKTDIAFEPMDTIELIHEILSMLKQTFPKVINFIEIFNKDIPYISADRTQIHQAILNLCVNARDAMPNGGAITIKVEKQSKERVQERFPAANQDSYVCISIIDTGEGMDDATRLRVFDPFFTTKPMGQGTGMGLSVVYGVVQAHQGFIDLESKLGHGTTFRLYFPIPTITEQAVDSQLLVESFEVGGTETILLVEDEEFLLDLVRLMLESKGYTVYGAKDGIEAIELYKLHKEEISLVFTDMGLPGLTGIDQFKRLKEINPNIKVIFASGFFEPDIKSELVKAGATGFIQKPYTTDDVLRTLREVLDKK